MSNKKKRTGRPARAKAQVQIGARVRELREGKGMTAEDVAIAAEITADRLYRIERGESVMNPIELRAIAEALGVKIDRLYEGVAA